MPYSPRLVSQLWVSILGSRAVLGLALLLVCGGLMPRGDPFDGSPLLAVAVVWTLGQLTCVAIWCSFGRHTLEHFLRAWMALNVVAAALGFVCFGLAWAHSPVG
jgi:hypothetical protein